MKKKLIACAAIAILLVSLAACSTTKNTTNDASAPASSTSVKSAESSATSASDTTMTYTEPSGYTKTSVAGTDTFSNLDLTAGNMKTIIVMTVPGSAPTEYNFASLSADDATKLLSVAKEISDLETSPIQVDGVDGTKITYSTPDEGKDGIISHITIMIVNADKLVQLSASGKQDHMEDVQKDFDALVASVKLEK